MATDGREDTLRSAPPAELSEWQRGLVSSLGLLVLTIVALGLLGLALRLSLLHAPAMQTRQQMLWPYGFFDLLWILPAGAFLWAARSLSREPLPGGPSCPALARRLAFFAAVAWFIISLVGGLYQWLAPIQSSLMNSAFLRPVAYLARGAAWIGVLWILLNVARWQRVSSQRRWLIAALGLTMVSAIAKVVYFAFYLRRHFLLEAIIEGRSKDLSWPSKVPVDRAESIAALIGFITVLVTLIALMRLRRLIRQVKVQTDG